MQWYIADRYCKRNHNDAHENRMYATHTYWTYKYRAHETIMTYILILPASEENDTRFVTTIISNDLWDIVYIASVVLAALHSARGILDSGKNKAGVGCIRGHFQTLFLHAQQLCVN